MKRGLRKQNYRHTFSLGFYAAGGGNTFSVNIRISLGFYQQCKNGYSMMDNAYRSNKSHNGRGLTD